MIDKENYQFHVADSLNCTFEQIKNNLDLKKHNLLLNSKDKQLDEFNDDYQLLNKENQLPTNSIPINSSVIYNSESLNKNSKFIYASSSFASNNTLDSLNSFSESELNDNNNQIQHSVDSGFSTLLSNNALSSSTPMFNNKLQKNLNCKKDEQAFITNLVNFLNFKNDNDSSIDNSLNDLIYNNLPEQIALNLIKEFSKKEPSFRIDPNELDCWLVSETDVPQKLLPIPNNFQFLAKHFNQINLINESDENEITNQSIDQSTPKLSSINQIQNSESNQIDNFENNNLKFDKTIEDNKLIDNDNKLVNNFLDTTTTSIKTISDEQQDDLQKLNNLFHNGKFLIGSFASLNNNIKYRGNNEWCPLRTQIHIYIHPQANRKELIAKQNFRCCGCGLNIEKQEINRMLYCYYTGKYFCQHGCHSKLKTILPAYIINKWSFKLYPVSNFAFQTISNNYTKPLFNINDLNPKLFKKVKYFKNLNDVRLQLLKLKDYICRCKKAGNLLVVYLMFEPKHIIDSSKDFYYSLEDLVNIKNDCKLLEKCCDLVQESINHIKNCTYCLAKGFICEFCSLNNRESSSNGNKFDILFPFEFGRVHQCENCYACYHLNCYHQMVSSNGIKCLKCVRIEKRKSTTLKEDLNEIDVY